jgi:hypothetical protein
MNSNEVRALGLLQNALAQILTFYLTGEVELKSLPLPQILAEKTMTEDRKHAILFAATLLCARKLIESIEPDKPNLAKQYFVDKAIQEAEFVLERIDKRCPG